MVDALEAERAASKGKATRADEGGFACEASAEPGPKSKSKRRRRGVQQSTDEPAP
jgi:hypothetical protein